jgi:hypothetical protein
VAPAGYLFKERIGNLGDLAKLHTVAAGGSISRRVAASLA